MRRIYKIAKAELATLFYSPVAWFILVVFAFQVGMTFVGLMEEKAQANTLGYAWGMQTASLLGGMRGLYTIVQQYLYLYIPLLTMGLMSRELSSGSIKLLYSSPVTNTQIILGKYLSVMVYGLVLIAILSVFMLFSAIAIYEADIPAVLAGLLGLYLLICAYAAIGLFMSSITSYQVVAAMGTLAVLAVLNFVGGMWQDVDFVRDITYWLAINGRADEFINGLICSEDVLYFVIVVALFLFLSILRLQARRQKSTWMATTRKYIGVIVIAMLLGYFTSRPKLMCYYDATNTKLRTLTPNSQNIVGQMDGGLTITTFVNILEENYWSGLPRNRNNDLRHFKRYLRFKPEIKMKYVYYYDKAKNPDLDKAYPIFDEIFPILEKTGTVEQIIMKGSKPVAEVKKDLGKYLDRIIYMPIVHLDRPGAMQQIDDFMKELHPVAFELLFESDTCQFPKQVRTKGKITLNDLPGIGVMKI